MLDAPKRRVHGFDARELSDEMNWMGRGSGARGRCLAAVAHVAMGWLLLAPCGARAQSPPDAPPITSPIFDQVVSPFDVHMEAGPFSDPDPGDTHFCTDWEIWTISPSERVWVTSCITGIEKVHTHLGDGVFENSHAGRTSLFYSTNYKLRVRFKDDTGLWGAFAELPFSTGSQTQVFPLIMNDVGGGTTWNDESSVPIILPPGVAQPVLRLESGSGALLLEERGNDGLTNTETNPAALPADVSPRLTIAAGSTPVALPPSRLAFTDGLGRFQTIYLPSVSVPSGGQIYFWIGADGSTYLGSAGQTSPDLSTLARGSPVPWTVVQPGFEVEIVATGFQLPVNIAFLPNPGPNSNDPLYYVTELYGTIKMVTRGGTVSNYASNLLNFDPGGSFPGSGEQGLAGIVVDPATGDLFAGMLYDSNPPNGTHYPKVVRFHSTDGGRTAATQTTILSMPGEEQGQSHFISNFSLGPDGKLYVHMGDGFTTATALNLDSFRGKILRMNLDGSAPSDNPFYNAANGINARDYVYAYGFRNPFGGAWRALDGQHYEVENGNGANDRFARVLSGTSYGWNGTDASMTINAIYNWVNTVAPVNITFIQPETFGGSFYPTSAYDHAFVSLSGSTYAPGPSFDSKRIAEFVVSPSGTLVSGPATLVQYNGTGRATAVGLATGPDGLYFTDLYKDQGATSAIDPGANVLRVRYRGVSNFVASPRSGDIPLTVTFLDQSNVPSPSGWFWDFGDGGTSTEQNPIHTYVGRGSFDVKLTVTGANGAVFGQKSAYVVVGPFPSGLIGKYYASQNFTNEVLSRIDSTVDFDWGQGSPSPAVPSEVFCVRWKGLVQPQFTQSYRFFTLTDDGVRLWVNGQLVVNQWHNQPGTEWFGDISLTAGAWYPITMEYYEDLGGAQAHLSWQCTGQAKQIIPSGRLRATDTVTAVEPPPAPAIERVTLFPSSPNPMRTSSQVGFAVPRSGHVTLRLFDVRGALVATLFDAVADGQRRYEFPFQPRNLAGGVYFEQLETAGTRLTKKLVVLR